MFTLIIEDKHGGIADEYSFEEGEFYIGRSHTSDIILPSDNVSRRHACLYTVDGKCYIEDLSSSNGVFVNGRRINEVYQIQRSAQIKVGDYYLHIESDAEQGVEEERTWCKLTGRNLAFANQVFRIQRKVNLIGRGKDCTLTIIDPSVSRIHTKISVERSGALTIEDLKSSNGTFVNDERIEVATIHHRDIIRFGNVEFMVEVPEQEGGTTAAKPAKEKDRDVRRERSRTDERERERPVAAKASGSPSAALQQAPAAKTSATAATFDDAWSKPHKRSSAWLIWTLVVGFIAVIATILVVAFKDQIFGGAVINAPEPVATPAPVPPPETTPPVPSPQEKARADAREKERKDKEIDAIIDVGKDHIRGKRWDLALGRYEAVLELDPLNETAQRAVNHIKLMQLHKSRLEEARRLRDALKRGDAANLLREIGDASVYHGEALEELQKLAEAKPTLLLTADNLLRQRDCQGAITTLKEVQLIDPKDALVVEKLDAATKLLGTRKCLN